ncbi:Non-specific serine/threonine protein kinase [Sulfidibacter corallicola]|uniref:Serine/threonine protein kinase n=1 Tax=Sulfidibacter corallicola TaxID=2818388 RepID=A0A8A4TJF7_SULCO|nr:serine/threonine-protein kinase [Sulfidibacter corallicola]QTD48981.1 serine/threonine protein kinase [Sulfidibacter corallicola]
MTKQHAAITDWARVKAILFEALAAPEAERHQRAEDLCADFPHLLAEVLDLLALDEDASLVIDKPAAVESDLTLDPERASFRDPKRIGRFEILEKLGQGGMGSVYLARSGAAETPAKVAIKIIRSGFASERIGNRFQQERDILANLKHPGICRLLEGGTDRHGAPYFVMEYIEGQPIHHYCDLFRMSIADRLRLLVEVCEAVDFAHRNLIVHRDLKPCNILVTSNGQPKLLDFGIAKLLMDMPDRPGGPLTATHMRPMTPAYAAPEQVLGHPVTTALDIYALGLLLYELLSGRQAQPLKSCRHSDLIRVVVKRNPPPFNQVLLPKDDPDRRENLTAIAEKRGTTLHQLRRTLQGDLEAITAKALRKEPDRRYPSAQALAEDIRRYLKGLPVQARQGRRLYVLQKWIQRHKRALAATTLLSFVLTTIGYVNWIEARRREETARRTREMTQFTVGLMVLASPEDRPAGIRQSEVPLLDMAERQLSEMKAVLPHQRSRLLRALGKVYQNRGMEERAPALLREALTLELSHEPIDDREVLETRLLLLQHYMGVGSFDEGFAQVDEIEAILDRATDLDTPMRATTLASLLEYRVNAMGFWAGDEKALAPLYTKLAAIFENEHDKTSDFYISFLKAATRYRMMESKFQDAVVLSEEAMARAEAFYGPEHAVTAEIQADHAILMVRMFQTLQARTHFETSLPVLERHLGKNHPKLGFFYSYRAVVDYNQNRTEAAEAGLADAMRILERTNLKTRLHLLSSLYYLLFSVQNSGNTEASKPLLTKALETLGEDTPHLACASGFHLLYATYLMERGEFEEAEHHYRKALAYRREALGENHFLTAYAYLGMGAWHGIQGAYDASEPYLEQGISIATPLGDKGFQVKSTGLAYLAQMHRRRGRHDEAIQIIDRLTPELDAFWGRNGRYAVGNRLLLASILLDVERFDDAQSVLEEAKGRITEASNLPAGMLLQMENMEKILAEHLAETDP